MRLIRVRKAMIDRDLRETFERYGTVGMQVCLADMNHFTHSNIHMKADTVLESLLPWLTEQYDKADRRESWLLILEITITILIVFEIVIELFWRR